jgi:hypothetical protein
VAFGKKGKKPDKEKDVGRRVKGKGQRMIFWNKDVRINKRNEKYISQG